MSKIGILAYGSLIEDPGTELAPLISGRVLDVETPFNIEFARSSQTRDGAPTVVPVDSLGAPVKAVILILSEAIDIAKARDLLWRRETRNEGSDRRYRIPASSTSQAVTISEIANLAGIDFVLYTRLNANILNPTANGLARLAIKSAAGEAGLKGRDGISYLISLKRQKIQTPLMAEYEAQILHSIGASSLQHALKLAQTRAIND